MAGSGGTQPWRQRRDCRVTLSTCNGNEDTNSKYTESGLQWGISASILFPARVSKRSLWQYTVCYWVCKQTTLTVYCSSKKYGVDPILKTPAKIWGYGVFEDSGFVRLWGWHEEKNSICKLEGSLAPLLSGRCMHNSSLIKSLIREENSVWIPLFLFSITTTRASTKTTTTTTTMTTKAMYDKNPWFEQKTLCRFHFCGFVIRGSDEGRNIRYLTFSSE